MGPILRFVFAGALGVFAFSSLWSGSAADSLITSSKDGKLLPRIGLPVGLEGDVIVRLQEERSEIRVQRCTRGGQSYCILGQCWTLAAPAYCAGPAKIGN